MIDENVIAPANKLEVPACPDCGDRRWTYHEDWSGVITFTVDAAGWREESREGQVDEDYWWLSCLGCNESWSHENGPDEGQPLREALFALS
jgi:hypothetical protein